jgi:ubiquinone/menaquinone biosynthesis C-methylase UbiE
MKMGEFNNSDHWDRQAEIYERTGHPFTRQYAEVALEGIALTPASRVLDVAAGTGALALAAARSGAQVLATDFSPGMVARIAKAGLPNIEVRVMDGQALDLTNGSFDAVFSIFGVFMFPNWRKGFSELARVAKPGGKGVVATWQARGAGSWLLLGRITRQLFPEHELSATPEGLAVLNNAENLEREMITAGFRDVDVREVTRDFVLDIAALDDPSTMFGASPDWTNLSVEQQAAVVAEIRQMAGDGDTLAVPSTALIAVATR